MVPEAAHVSATVSAAFHTPSVESALSAVLLRNCAAVASSSTAALPVPMAVRAADASAAVKTALPTVVAPRLVRAVAAEARSDRFDALASFRASAVSVYCFVAGCMDAAGSAARTMAPVMVPPALGSIVSTYCFVAACSGEVGSAASTRVPVIVPPDLSSFPEMALEDDVSPTRSHFVLAL